MPTLQLLYNLVPTKSNTVHTFAPTRKFRCASTDKNKMKTDLPKPHKGSLIYQDSKLYACLASFPIVKGHTVVVWKKHVSDLHLLPKKDYEHLMNKVDEIRNGLMKALGVKKVYLVYMDEANHVHWHLIPRYNEKGYDVLRHRPIKLKDFSLAKIIRKNLK